MSAVAILGAVLVWLLILGLLAAGFVVSAACFHDWLHHAAGDDQWNRRQGGSDD